MTHENFIDEENIEVYLTDSKGVARMLGISVRMVNNLVKEEDFPQPFSLSKSIRAVRRWRIQDIREWINGKADNDRRQNS